MTNLKSVLLLLFVFTLAACGGGGGGTSDGGGSSSDNLEQFAGQYAGPITATVTTSAGTQTFQRDVIFEISADGKTLTVESQQFALGSNAFQVNVALPLAEAGTTCTLDVQIMGNITTEQISGTVSGSGDCVIDGQFVPGTLSGYFAAARVS